MSLTIRAKHLHPNRRNAAKLVQAIRYMRQRKIWVIEHGRKPSWGNAK